MAIIVAGSIGIDFVSVSPRLPQMGETVLASQDLYVGPGGKGFNQAAGAKRLGGDVRFATKIGGEDLGHQARGFLEQEGLLGPLVAQSEKANQVALIFVDENGRNMISVAPGASSDLLPEDVAKIEFDAGDIFLAQLEVPVQTVTAAARRAHEAGATVVLNPAPAAPLPPELLEIVDIATPNETELGVLTGAPTTTEEEIVAAGRLLLEMGVGTVIATVGDRGSVHITAGDATVYPPLPVTPIDTTGAGDAFNAGLVVGLSRGQSLADAIALGTQAGAYCVTQMGVRDGLATGAQLQDLVASL